MVKRMQTTSNSLKRCTSLSMVVLSGLGTVLVPWLLRLATRPAADALRGVPVPPADALLAGVSALAAAGVAWLLLGVALEVLAHAPGRVGRSLAGLSAVVTPALVRRAVGVALGLGVGLGGSPSPPTPVRAVSVALEDAAQAAVRDTVVPAAVAAPAPVGGGRGLPEPGWSPDPDPGWTPDAPVVRPQPDVTAVSPAGRRSASDGSAEIVVRRGDSLWAIAARHLGPGATDAEVAAEWPRWYAANRATIGADPDLVLPGQVLRPPEDPR
jgi:nucleoid-associated protein YgaU